MKDSKLKTAGMRKLHWGKAVMSIVVTLAAMPLTHSLARVLKEGTTGVEQFYAGMGMGAFGLFMVIAGVFVKGISGRLYWDCSEECSIGWELSTFCLCILPTVSVRRHNLIR